MKNSTVQGKLERATLRSALRGMEWCGARKRPQRTGQGNQNRTDNGRTDLEGSCNRGRDQAGVTEHSNGEGGGTGDGTPGYPSGERRCGLPTGDKVDAGHSYPEWRGLRCIGDRGGESASGGISGGLESGKGMTGGEHGQLWP